MFTFPFSKVKAAFKSFRFSFFRSIKLRLESRLLNIFEFFELIVVESNWPTKSPEMVFKSGVNSLALSAGGTLNVYSQIGLIALVGLISKHGIMMVEFANQLQEQGRTVRAAIIEAAAIRLRPILMTTAAMVLGAIPLALAHGAGAESRQSIGWVLVGGMSFGTLMTLFVLPTFYLMLSKTRHMLVIDEGKLGSGK